MRETTVVEITIDQTLLINFSTTVVGIKTDIISLITPVLLMEALQSISTIIFMRIETTFNSDPATISLQARLGHRSQGRDLVATTALISPKDTWTRGVWVTNLRCITRITTTSTESSRCNSWVFIFASFPKSFPPILDQNP
jgi:hypothetical protein